MSGAIDWRLAERTAAVVGAAPLPGQPAGQRVRRYRSAELREACDDAIEAVVDYAGLGRPGSPPAPELIDRRAWSRTALASLALATAPVEHHLAAEVSLPGPVGAVARRGLATGIGFEVGLATGYVGRRVLGQYDIGLFGPQRPARLLFVRENLEAVRSDLGADPGAFLRWIAMHETAHVVQFECVPWLAGHLRNLVGGLLAAAAGDLDRAKLSAAARRLLGDPRRLAGALLRGEAARALANPETRARLDRLQATMSAIEGHAEHVMDAAARELGPETAGLRRELERRRGSRGVLAQLLERLLGLDAKLRQYELGRAFCDAVVATAGESGLRSIWTSPGSLPSAAELARPRLWLARTAALRSA